ncbi:hypothetical protein F2Q70_00038537 [Brassica cretica]|uniref:Uncharacterized protein n=1 Tax=Brassica cretica TaxID=69181 RepID=A0A8S9K813_BRACR|nr:hypothetical protein F2Q70_00038537 [Brassica cretica]
MANEKQIGLVYLHGDLELQIIEARYLPNMDLHFERIRRVLNTLNLFDKHCSSPKGSHRRTRNKYGAYTRARFVDSRASSPLDFRLLLADKANDRKSSARRLGSAARHLGPIVEKAHLVKAN